MKKYRLFLAFIFLGTFGQHAHAQYNDYKYYRELKTQQPLWNNVRLPWDIYEHLKSDYADIRICTITPSDTIEEPYLLDILESKKVLKKLNFNLINQVKDRYHSYYTFALDSIQTINEIALDFQSRNFDTQVTLSGSNDNKKWFIIKENQRILAIHNQEVDYSFTKINFPNARFKFLKLQVDGKTDLNLQSSSITYDITKNVDLHPIKTTFFASKNDKKTKKTSIFWATNKLSPMSSLQITVSNQVDFIRPIRVFYATDSSLTKDGMTYQYHELFRDVISSFEPSIYYFPPTVLKRLKIEIINDDNQALNVEKVNAQANAIELRTRISNKGKHLMLYGNVRAHFPTYDIEKFQNKIPKKIPNASLGEERLNPANFKEKLPEIKPVFENKFWLWGLMALIIGLLGWYTFKMMK